MLCGSLSAAGMCAGMCARDSRAFRSGIFHLHHLVPTLHALAQGDREGQPAVARAPRAQAGRAGAGLRARGFKAAAERLAGACLEGNAWHADHILPVYKGGGLCQIENLRTLCVPCHQARGTPSA